MSLGYHISAYLCDDFNHAKCVFLGQYLNIRINLHTQMATSISNTTKHVVYLTRKCQAYCTISRERLHRTTEHCHPVYTFLAGWDIWHSTSQVVQ